MDEELKVVVTSVLEADEAASAQRIAGQLPAISKMVEQQGKIKIGVEFNDANVRAESQRVKQSIKSALTTQEVGIKLRVTQDARGMLRDALSGLKVDENISQAMTRNLTNMNVEIDKINAGFVKAGKSKERLLQLTISGTDQEQRSVQIMQQYDQSGRKVAETVKQIEMNLKAQRTEAERAAKQSANENEQRVAALTKQMDALEKVRSDYLGSGRGEAVLNSDNLDNLVQKYEQIRGEIQSLQTTAGAYSKTRQAEIDSEIAALGRMVTGYQNAEKAERAGQSANEQRLYDLQKQLDLLEKIRANYMGSGKGDAVTGEAHLAELSNKYSEIESKIKALQNATGAYSKTQKAEINSDIEALNRLVVAYQKAERTATDLRSKDVTTVKTEQEFKLDEFEAKLKTAGTLTDTLKTKIGELRKELSSVGDSQGMTKFLDNFGAVKAEAGAAAAAEQFRQKIASVNAEMAAMPSNISAMEGRMRQLSAPTDNLKTNVAEVHRLMAEWNNDPSDEKKIHIYEQINEKLKLCNSEITRLNQAQTSGVRDFKLTQGLDKAKADLATIRRQWSAFTNDRGLEQKFQTLSKGLSNIRNQADLTKWNAQFSTLKSEIKAAGLNMQSLGDIIRNNLAKVGQWLGATTIIFRAFSTIKTAVSTVIDMDTAMIDLRKTTNATEAEYRAFYQSANETARALGATTEEVISQTAEWSRLGYTMQEAAELAKNSAIFSAVSPGMGQELATDGLVSIIKAFDVDVEDSMDGIISKVNAVGKSIAQCRSNAA